MVQIENDGERLAQLLASTLNAQLRKQAEDELSQLHQLPGFTPTLLQLVMAERIEMPVRQAGVIYLKNMVNQYWTERKPEKPDEIVPFSLPENDKQLIRDNLIESVVHSPETIRVQLIVCVRTISTQEFPEKWPTIIDKVVQFMQTNNINAWYGALQAFYQVCKIYEYKSIKEREIYHNSMRALLPLFLERLYNLKDNAEDLSVLVQKQILKIFYTFIQFLLPLDVLNNQSITNWIEVCNMILQAPIPSHVDEIDKDERPDLSWWKIKKWSLRILNRIFERYGTPNSVSKEYNEFANFFLKGFAINVLTTILKILEQYRNGIYISPRVIQQSVIYIEQAVSPSYTWKFLKLHMLVIIQEILYPLLCHNDEDEELFENDPVEYIKTKYDVFEDFVSPVNAARQLIYEVASKRKDMLQKTMVFCMGFLQNGTLTPRQKDGILHIVGTVAKVLLKRNFYKDQVELMLVTYVFPEFQSPHGFLRARACWVLKTFARVNFKNQDNLTNASNYIKHCILNDPCLPVNVEACLALHEMLTEDEIEINQLVKDNVAAHIQQIMIKMLNLIRDTENDDISNVIQRLIYVYEEELSTFAVEIMQHLCETFLNLIKSTADADGSANGGAEQIGQFMSDDFEANDDKTITAVGILSTIDSILNVMEEKPEVLGGLETAVLPVIYAIIQNSMIDFYEELFSLICTLTTRQVSERMWSVLYVIHDLFQHDAADYFTELMPVLHNYVMIDTKGFLSDQKRIECIFNVAKQVLNSNTEDDEAEMYAAKLLEVIILQCHHQIDNFLPSFLELVFLRLQRETPNSEVRTICLQVIIAALWSNTDVVLRTLDNYSQNSNQSVLLKFLEQWLADIDCFLGLHDRKICALGMCMLLELAPKRPHDVFLVAGKLLPSCCILFENLERVYQRLANKSDDSESDDYDTDVKELESDEDDQQDESNKILQRLNKKYNNNGNGNGDENGDELETEESDLDDYSDDEEDDDDKTMLENFNTCIDDNDEVDEFVTFKDTLQNLQVNNQQYYELLTAALTPDQCKAIQNFIITANRRVSEKESKKILAAGGYSFTNFNIPTNFNFGGANQ